MKFKTELSFKSSGIVIEPQEKLLFIGSCFSENIGKRFKECYFKTIINPFGTLFNPLSISNLMISASQNNLDFDSDIFEFKGEYKFLGAYSKFSSTSKTKLIDDIKFEFNLLKSGIDESNFIFITLGSSIVHRFLQTDRVVANCHKIPNHYFRVEQLELNVVIDCFKKMIDSIRLYNCNAKIVFTVSPVRYLAYGFKENQVSKACMITALYEVSKTHDFFYLPVFELFMDELRDYRFYNKDLIHPSDFALDYVWEKIVNETMSESGKIYVDDMSAIWKLLNHRILKDDYSVKETHDLLIDKRKSEMKIKYPFLEFE